MEATLVKPNSWDFESLISHAYEYDYRACGGLCGDYMECDDAEIVGLRLDTDMLEAPFLLSRFVGNVSKDDVISSGLVAHVQKHVDLSNPNNYEMETGWDYSGQIATVSFTDQAKSSLVKALDSWKGWA